MLMTDACSYITLMDGKTQTKVLILSLISCLFKNSFINFHLSIDL